MRHSRVVLGPVGVGVAGVGVGALLGLAGCSGAADDASAGGAKARPAASGASADPADPADPGKTVREAVAATRGTSSRLDQKIELGDGTTTYRMSITGDFDMAADRGRLSVDLPGGAISHLDEIFVGDKVYLRGAEGLEGHWGSIDRDKAEAHAVLRAPLNDPEHVLVQVAAVKKVSDEGTAKVNGARTTHYRGMLDHATATLRTEESLRARFDEARESLGEDIPVFADAWVDGSGRVVRTRLTFSMAGVNVTTTMTFSDFGKPVKATAPPAADTVPATEVKGVLPG
ncbi:hypothetical protein [Streptomyces sp. NBC_01506]|uniref:hypothetical protein n=1 Tax=Streptomyces sp. NBC_01506 TaxID=2903887 RepID=UPI003862EE18